MNPTDVQERTKGRRWSAQLLRAVPYRNGNMTLRARRDGGVLASVPLKRPKYLVPPLSWIIPFSSHRRCQLDRLGAKILQMCDGSRNIEQIIEAFADEHKLSFREAQLPVMQFLRQLTDRGIVAIVGFQKDANES